VTILPGGTTAGSEDKADQTAESEDGDGRRSAPQDEQRKTPDGDGRDRSEAQTGNSAVTILPGTTTESSGDDGSQEKGSIDNGPAFATEDKENAVPAVTVLPGWSAASGSKARSEPTVDSVPANSRQTISSAFLPLPLSGIFDGENECVASAIKEFIMNTRSVPRGDALRAFRKMRARNSVLADSPAQRKLEEIFGAKREEEESAEVDVIVRSVEQVQGTQTWQAEWVEENRGRGPLIETYMGDFEAGLFASKSESGTGGPSEILILDFDFVNVE
jgi:hypothetical protein